MKVFTNILIAVLIYVVLSIFGHRMRHPEYTETQLFLKMRDALLWR